MRSSAALKQLRLIASQGLPSHQSIPLMLGLIEELIPCCFANFFWLDERGMPTDSYLPVVIPSAMDAFIGNQRRLIEDPAEPSIDKYVRLGPRVGASRSLDIDAARFDRSILYNEVYRPYGIEDALNFVIRERGRPRGIVLVNRDVRPGRWTRAEADLLLSAESHFRAALAGRPLWPASAPAGTPAEATAFLVADAKGAILLATEGAPALLSQYLDVPIGPDFAFGKLLERLPPALEHLVQRLRLIDSGLASKAARQARSTRWGEISAHAYRASALPNGPQGHGQFVLVLERRPSRAAQVLGAVGRLPVAPRERHIAFLLGMEVARAEIARRLDLTASTLRSYLRNIYDRTGAAGRDQLVALLTAGQASPAPRDH